MASYCYVIVNCPKNESIEQTMEVFTSLEEAKKRVEQYKLVVSDLGYGLLGVYDSGNTEHWLVKHKLLS